MESVFSFWGIGFISILVAILLALWVFFNIFFKGYMEEKGKNLATKEDAEKLTKIVKNIEHKFESARIETQQALASSNFSFDLLKQKRLEAIETVWKTIFDARQRLGIFENVLDACDRSPTFRAQMSALLKNPGPGLSPGVQLFLNAANRDVGADNINQTQDFIFTRLYLSGFLDSVTNSYLELLLLFEIYVTESIKNGILPDWKTDNEFVNSSAKFLEESSEQVTQRHLANHWNTVHEVFVKKIQSEMYGKEFALESLQFSQELHRLSLEKFQQENP